MRMFRFSSWISESRGGDDTPHTHKPIAMEQVLGDVCDYSVQPVGATKRKLGDHDAPQVDLTSCAAAKRMKESDMGAAMSGPQPTDIEPTAQNTATTTATTNSKTTTKPTPVARLREVIDHQLSLEVLMKHDELRRIDQELAKAMVALDQLRRCHTIPFPVSLGDPEAMLTVSTGTGPSIPQARRSQPRYASPFGVTEGPYSRHYASWLIPDPEFDGVQPSWGPLPGAAAGVGATLGRTTRNSLALETPTAKPRRGGASAAASKKLHSLPSGYPPPKETAGPLVLKRADGQWVKLVCLVCHRENFGSTQGFINHCRIAHHREFKSHEEAASQSGQPVEVDSATGGIVGAEPKPAATTPSSTLVHPLIRSVPYDRNTVNAVLERISEGRRMFYEGNLPGIKAIPSATTTASSSHERTTPAEGFVPSDSTPSLSRLLSRRGFKQNLDELVAEAKTPPPPPKRRKAAGSDGGCDSSSESDSDIEPLDATSQFSTPISSGASKSAVQPQRHAPILPPGFVRPKSSKGPLTTVPSRRPGLSSHHAYATSPPPPQLPNPAARALRIPMPMLAYDAGSDADADVDPDPDLSPATASNKAPSLISDDGEYSLVEDGDSSGAESESEVPEAEVEIEEVEVEEVGGDGDAVVRGGRMRGGKGRGGKGKGEVGFVRVGGK